MNSGTIANRSVPFPSEQASGNVSTERLRSQLNKKQNWYAIVPFSYEQFKCPFQKLERRWNVTIAFLCELGLNWKKVGQKASHAAKELVTVISVTFFLQ